MLIVPSPLRMGVGRFSLANIRLSTYINNLTYKSATSPVKILPGDVDSQWLNSLFPSFAFVHFMPRIRCQLQRGDDLKCGSSLLFSHSIYAHNKVSHTFPIIHRPVECSKVKSHARSPEQEIEGNPKIFSQLYRPLHGRQRLARLICGDRAGRNVQYICELALV